MFFLRFTTKAAEPSASPASATHSSGIPRAIFILGRLKHAPGRSSFSVSLRKRQSRARVLPPQLQVRFLSDFFVYRRLLKHAPRSMFFLRFTTKAALRFDYESCLRNNRSPRTFQASSFFIIPPLRGRLGRLGSSEQPSVWLRPHKGERIPHSFPASL